jgi:hypothetical protein
MQRQKTVRLPYWTCTRCRHGWIGKAPRTSPKRCPQCKSPYWNRPYTRPQTAQTLRATRAARAQHVGAGEP